jgi:hypothetical protein
MERLNGSEAKKRVCMISQVLIYSIKNDFIDNVGLGRILQ